MRGTDKYSIHMSKYVELIHRRDQFHAWASDHYACKIRQSVFVTQTITVSSLLAKLLLPLLIEACSTREAMLWAPNTRARVSLFN